MQPEKVIVETEAAPSAIGPYSQAVGYNGMLFLSGQIAIDPDTGELIDAGVEEQVKQVMANLSAVLDAAGVSFSHVLRTTIYLNDIDDFEDVNEVYSRYFDTNPPARACVEVETLPRDADVEIDMIAARPETEEEAS